MIDKKDSFIVRKKYWNQIQKLTANQKVEFMECMFSYQNEGSYESEDGAVCMLLDIMIDEWKNDEERYLEICEKNREIALERERKKKLKREKSHEQHERAKSYTNVTVSTDNDSDYRLLSNDNNVDSTSTTKNVNEILYDAYPFKDKGIDKQVCDKLIDKQFKQGSTLEGMLKEMKLELLEMRIKQGKSHQYGRKMETWLKEYVEGMADSEDRLIELLSYHRKRLDNGPNYRKNPRDELCDLFGTDLVKRLFMETKQGTRIFTT